VSEEGRTDLLTEPAAAPGWVDEAPGRHFGRSAAVGWGIAFVASGIVWILVQLDVPIAWELVLPTAIILVGVTLLLGVRGAARGGLIGLGGVLAVVAVATMALPTFSFTAGERVVVGGEIADLETYEHGAGVLRLDLRELDLPEGRTTVEASVAFGELVVVVPPDVTVEGTARVRVGEVSAFGRSTAGFAPRRELRDPGADDGRVLELDLEVGFGRIDIRR
jgi:hypothetical protein